MRGLIIASYSPPAVYILIKVKNETKRSTEFRPRYKLKHLMFVIYLITCQILALVILKDSSAVATGATKCPVSAPDLHLHNIITGFVKLLYLILQT